MSIHRLPHPAALRTPLLTMLLSACAGVHATGLVTVDRHPITYAMSGNGTPTVVFQSGLGDGKVTWSAVERELGDKHHIFAYDRPGYGGSPATDAPRDPCAIAHEAHELLRDAHVPPPYLLVGHSLGGLYQYAFARMYPDEVAGLVLLDPTHPDHWASIQREAPTAAATLKVLRATAFTPTERQEFDQQTTCLDRIEALPLRPVPTLILTSTNRSLLEKGDFEGMMTRLRNDWLRLTGAPKIDAVAGAGHYIQKDQPKAVARAIDDVALQVKGD